MRFAFAVAYFFYTFAPALVLWGITTPLRLKGNRVKIPNRSRCCESQRALRHLKSLDKARERKLWEGFVERDKSEDLPSVYNEIVPAANGLVCDLSYSRVTYFGRKGFRCRHCMAKEAYPSQHCIIAA